MDVFIRILLAVFVVIGVYSVIYAFLYSWKYKGTETFADWEIVLRPEDGVAPEMILRGLLATADRSNVPVRRIVVHTGNLSPADEDVCRRFEEKYPIFAFDGIVSRETATK